MVATTELVQPTVSWLEPDWVYWMVCRSESQKDVDLVKQMARMIWTEQKMVLLME